jgi:hypothetical protein
MAPFYPEKLALTSPTCGGPSVSIVRSKTHATECVNCMVGINVWVLHNYIYYALWYSKDPLNIIWNITSFHTPVRGKCQKRWGSQPANRVPNNVLLAQTRCTVSGTVVDELGVMIIKGKRGRIQIQLRSVHHKSYMKSPGTEPEPQILKASEWLCFTVSGALNKCLVF